MSKRKNDVTILDSTLRDGSQAEGISFSLRDKISIVRSLDELGVKYIEAGNPSSNPKDIEFFEKAKSLKLKNSQIVPFGTTRRKNTKCENDENLKSLLDCETKTVVIFGKCWDFQVKEILKTSLEENLLMIRESVEFLCKNGRNVIFDAEHFFDGYVENRDYAFSSIEAAIVGGAKTICLCDTNGGTMPMEILKTVTDVTSHFSKTDVEFGIHTHNDGGLAVANSLMAVEGGCSHVQGTLLGFGERTGNANLSTVISCLELKMGVHCLPKGKLQLLTPVCHTVAETANILLSDGLPYVGKNSFAHKAGMHIDAVVKNPEAYEHINPESIGNERVFLLSEVAGRTTILEKIKKIDSSIKKDDEVLKEIISKMKKLEMEGYQFEGAEGSFELLARKIIGKYKPFFKLIYYKTSGDFPRLDKKVSSVVQIKIEVDGKIAVSAGEGLGPVHALDTALRNALVQFYPCLKSIWLTDFKVRVLDERVDESSKPKNSHFAQLARSQDYNEKFNETSGTASKVRVLIETTDGSSTWTTVGVSQDIIEASWFALVDSFEYKLIREVKNV